MECSVNEEQCLFNLRRAFKAPESDVAILHHSTLRSKSAPSTLKKSSILYEQNERDTFLGYGFARDVSVCDDHSPDDARELLVMKRVYDLLSPWSTYPDSERSLKKTSLPGPNCNLKPKKAVQNGIPCHAQKNKLGRLYVQDQTSKAVPEFAFQHLTDTSGYVTDYRRRKLEKMRSCYTACDDISRISSTDTAPKDDMLLAACQRLHLYDMAAVNLDAPLVKVTAGDRQHDDELVRSRLKFVNAARQRVGSESSVRILGSKGPVDKGACELVSTSESKPSKVLIRPHPVSFFDAVVRLDETGKGRFESSTLNPHDLLHCRKLTEVHARPQVLPWNSNDARSKNAKWRPVHVLRPRTAKIRLEKPCPIDQQSKNSYENDHAREIIKRLVRHYDPSLNELRTSQRKDGGRSGNALLAPV